MQLSTSGKGSHIEFRKGRKGGFTFHDGISLEGTRPP